MKSGKNLSISQVARPWDGRAGRSPNTHAPGPWKHFFSVLFTHDRRNGGPPEMTLCSLSPHFSFPLKIPLGECGGKENHAGRKTRAEHPPRFKMQDAIPKVSVSSPDLSFKLHLFISVLIAINKQETLWGLTLATKGGLG